MKALALIAAAAAALLGVPTFAAADSAPARAIRVMTYNVEFNNADPKASIDAIEASGADVVLLQEITQGWQDALAKRFAKLYPHQQFHLHRVGPGGLAVLSKLPITAHDSSDSPSGGWFFADRVVVITPFGAVQLLDVHLRPAIDNGSWVRGYLTTPPLRLAEITEHWKHLDAKLPTVVAGDFNEEATGSAVKFLVDHGMTIAAAKGPPTWHLASADGKQDNLMTGDLDHVLVRGLVAGDGAVLDAGTSDHRPVVVTLTAPPTP